MTMPQLPAVIREAFTSSRPRIVADRSGEPIPEGQRDKYMASLAGTMRRRGMTQDEIAAALHAANQRCTPPMDHRDVDRIAWSVSRYEPDDTMVREIERGKVEVYFDKPPESVVYERAGFRWLDVPRLLTEPVPEPDWLWQDMIEKGELCWLAGLGKTGKSMVAMFLACAAVSGRERFLGLPVGQVSQVIYLDCENREKTVQRRLHYTGVPVKLGEHIRYAVLRGADLGSEAGLEALDLATRDGGLLILDSLVGMHRSDEDKATEVRAFVSGVRKVAEANGVTVIGLAHENRGGSLRGSLDWRNAADRTLSLTKDDAGYRTLASLDVRDGADDLDPVVFRFRMGPDGHLLLEQPRIEIVGDPDEFAELVASIRGRRAMVSGLTESEVAGLMGVEVDELFRAAWRVATS